MATPRLLARLGPILAAIGLRLHQARLSAGLVPCTGCGDFATSLADLCDDCDNDTRANCEARNEEEDAMPKKKSTTHHTLFHAELRDVGPPTEPSLRLLVSARLWELRQGPETGTRLYWFNPGRSMAHSADAARKPGRVYPEGWHPSEGAAVQAYFEHEDDKVMGFLKSTAEAQKRRDLAGDWLREKARP